MTMKVQGSIAAAVQNNQNGLSAGVSQPAQALPGRTSEAPASARARPDDLSRLQRPDFDRHLGLRPAGLSWGDRFTASDLHKTLSNPLNNHILSAERKSETITRDQSGIFRGPNGQPLVPVTLDDGKTAYVDPNTNKYYLTDEQPGKDGSVRTLPAIDLPQDARFSNQYFNDSDARELTQIAESRSPFGPRPFPRLPELDFPRPDRPSPVNPRDELPGTPREWLQPLRNKNIAV